jgi:hypothetical protein
VSGGGYPRCWEALYAALMEENATATERFMGMSSDMGWELD